MQQTVRSFLALLLVMTFATLTTACGGGVDSGVRVISPESAYDTLFEDQPEDLVVLDIRTPEEYRGQRLPEATLIDFYEPDFAQQIAELDRDATYIMYCRSGNRSEQARALMEDLGFTDVRDIEGGILNWLDSGMPFVTSNG